MPTMRMLTLAGLLLAVSGVLLAQEAAPASPEGTWKFLMPTIEGNEGQPVLLLKFEKEKDGWKGDILASRLKLPGLKIEKVKIADKVMGVTLKSKIATIQLDMKLTDAKATKHYGEARLGKSVMVVEMEKSALTDLEEFSRVREDLANEPLGIRSVALASRLIADAADMKAKEAEVRAWAEKAYKSAQLYGPRFTRETVLNLSRALAEQKGYEKVALQYAKRAEASLDEKNEPPASVKEVLDVLFAVLEKTGDKDAAAAVLVKLKRLKFDIKPIKYTGRTAKHDRAVLAEVFTTSHARGDVAANMIVDALQKTFKGADVNVLMYYQHQVEEVKDKPLGDPLACAEGEQRLVGYYGRKVRTLPAMIVNGNSKVVLSVGGASEESQDRYDRFVELIEPMIEAPPAAKLSLKAFRKGDMINIDADVNELAETGEDIRLRVALVETEAVYQGKSGGKVHFNVVRGMPGGEDGIPMKVKATKKNFSVDLGEMKKAYAKYCAKVDKDRPFPDKERPLELKSLRVVAFIQNDATNEVFQSVQVDVKGE